MKVINIYLAPGGRSTIVTNNVTFELHGVEHVAPSEPRNIDIDEAGNITIIPAGPKHAN